MTSNGKIRILVVDDHPIFRHGLSAILTTEPDLMICGEAVTAKEALQSITTSKPDIVLLDLMLEGSHGMDLLKDMTAYHPELAVIVLSMHDEVHYAESVLRAGAKGYVMKRESPHVLIRALRKVLGGSLAFSDEMTARLLYHASSAPRSQRTLPLDRLSDRERQILEMIGRGMTPRTIAENLSISIKTVQAHRENLKLKLDLPDASSLALFAIRWFETNGNTETK